MGRPKGSRNKANNELKVAARKYTPEALKTLRSIMKESESDQARVAAARELLDRGHGKAVQGVTMDFPTVPLFALPVGVGIDLGATDKDADDE